MSDETTTTTEFAEPSPEAWQEPSAEAWQALSEATDAAIEADVATTDTAEDTPDDGDNQVGNEAAKYRRKLRTAEAERDQLAQQLTAIRRNQIDNHTTELGIKPEALWAAGTKLEDLLDGDGVPDLQKITAAVRTARDTLGIVPASQAQLGTRSGSGASGPGEYRQASWAAALNSPRREQ